MKRFITAISLIMPLYVFSSDSIVAQRFIGRWSSDCSTVTGVTIDNLGKISVAVNENQIHITSRGQYNDNTATLFLESPDELGRGGMMLDWDKFSTKIPIAKITLMSASVAKLQWYGFFNSTKEQYVWTTEPEFIQQPGKLLSRCDDADQ